MLKFSEKNLNYEDTIFEEGLIVDILESALKNGKMDWSALKDCLDDNKHFNMIKDLWKKDPQFTLETYKIIMDDALNSEVEAAYESFIKESQRRTEYGEIPENVQENFLDYSDLRSEWGYLADEAIELVNKLMPNLLSEISVITLTDQSDVAGVFEPELSRELKKPEEIEERQGIAFRLSPSKINTEVISLSNNLSEQDKTDTELMDEIRKLVIAEIIVHEAVHANGADDEGAPVAAERSFLNQAINMLNNERQIEGLDPLPIDLKS